MASETPASGLTQPVENSQQSTSPAPPATDNMVAINAPLGRPAQAPAKKKHREEEEDLARLQDQLMDVLEENQQLRMELDAWRTAARAAQQNRAS